MTVSFVIPVYNHFSLLNELLVSIQNHTSPDEVLVVDDASPDQTTISGIEWWRMTSGIRVMRNIENTGFLESSNNGLRAAVGDIICLISTDVIIEDNLSLLLKQAIRENPKRLIGGTVYNGSTGWNQFGAEVFPYAEGWLLGATREAWNTLGYFDQRYAPNDFEDVDLSTTALRKGFELYSLNSPRIRHIGAQSIGYNEQREELTNRNREKFRKKWITGNSEKE